MKEEKKILDSETQEAEGAATVQGQAKRPIIMSGDNPKLTLEGRKTQTRRVVNLPPGSEDTKKVTWGCVGGQGFGFIFGDRILPCPYGVAGDRLWVRETFCGPVLTSERGELFERYYYKSTHQHERPRNHKAEIIPWTPSIHMPRSASRITLEITKVRVERLQDISEEDAKAEGVTPTGRHTTHRYRANDNEDHGHRLEYRKLWNSLHGKGAWDRNDWVWVIEFRLSQKCKL